MRYPKSIYPVLKEKNIFFPLLLLTGIGIIMVFSASSSISMEEYKTLYYYVQKQAIFLIIGLGVMIIAASLPLKFYQKMAYFILFTTIILLVALLIPALQIKAGGACRWIRLGAITFQPSEVAKLAMILFMGHSLAKKQEQIHNFYIGFIPHVIIYLIFAGLIMIQPDFGTIVVLAGICWGMMFVAGIKIIHLLSPLPVIIPLAYFAVFKVRYRLTRITTFLNPWDDPYDAGYQITQSLKAFGSGGLWGKGIGLGMQKMHYLPEPHTDFIFSIIGEELGLIGVVFILILYSIILNRGAAIARQSSSSFGSIVAAGIIIYLGLQVIINIGVSMGVLPTKGLTLPFISYGGTSLVVNMAAMGILMNIGASSQQ